MSNLNNPNDLQRYLAVCMKKGFLTAAVSGKRMPTAKLIAWLSLQVGPFNYRNYHVDLLARAYGFAFVNREKQARIAKLNKTPSPTPA